MIVFTVSKYNQGVARCSRGGGLSRGCVFRPVRPRGVCSGLDGAGHHAVRRVWKLRRHGCYLAARRVRARSSLRKADLRDTWSSGQGHARTPHCTVRYRARRWDGDAWHTRARYGRTHPWSLTASLCGHVNLQSRSDPSQSTTKSHWY